MKKVTANIRPELLEKVNQALIDAKIPGMTVHDVLGRGKHGGIKFVSRGSTYNITLLPKTELTILCNDSDVEKIVQIISSNAKTEKNYGDGKIYIQNVESVITISSGKTES
jgi:nitrogen regulatory protein PII